MEGRKEGKMECERKGKKEEREIECERKGKKENEKEKGRNEGRTYLCSSLSICLAREILFLMEDIYVTSTGKESRSFPTTQS